MEDNTGILSDMQQGATAHLNGTFSKENWIVEHNILSSTLFNKKTN
jgi:hypothetical protein